MSHPLSIEGNGTHQWSKGVLCVQPELAGVRLVLLNVQTDGSAGRPSARESEDLAMQNKSNSLKEAKQGKFNNVVDWHVRTCWRLSVLPQRKKDCDVEGWVPEGRETWTRIGNKICANHVWELNKAVRFVAHERVHCLRRSCR